MNVEFSKSEMKLIIYIWVFGLFIAFIFFVYIFNKDTTSSWEAYYMSKLANEYKGKVVNKYFDKSNRSTPTIQLDDKSLVLLISNDWYDQFETGDYIFKENGSLIIKLIKKNSQDTLYFDYRDIEIKN